MDPEPIEPPAAPTRPSLMERLRGVRIDLSPMNESVDFRYLWFGSAVSYLGSRITFVAISFQVYDLTGSTAAVGLLGLFELVPLLFLSLVGGAIADAVDRRRLLLVTETLGGICSIFLAYNASLGAPRLWVIYLLTTAIAALYALGAPAFRSLTPILVRQEKFQAAAALMGVTRTFSAVAGPAAAGLLIGSIGLKWTYVADVFSFGAILIAVWLMDPVPRNADTDRPGLRSILDGVRFLKGRPVLRGSFVVDIIAMVLGMPMALLPAVARSLGGVEILGLLYAAPPAGALIASLTSGWTGRMKRHGLIVYLAVICWGASLIAFGLSSTLWLSLLTLALAGASDMISAIFRSSILQTAAPRNMLGRLSGLELAVVTSGPALGDLEAGLLAAVTSVRFSIIAGGVGCIVGVLLMALLSPAFARYNSADPTA